MRLKENEELENVDDFELDNCSEEMNFEEQVHQPQNFESNIVIKSLKSFDDDSETNKDKFCDVCLKVFNFKIKYQNNNLENILH